MSKWDPTPDDPWFTPEPDTPATPTAPPRSRVWPTVVIVTLVVACGAGVIIWEWLDRAPVAPATPHPTHTVTAYSTVTATPTPTPSPTPSVTPEPAPTTSQPVDVEPVEPVVNDPIIADPQPAPPPAPAPEPAPAPAAGAAITSFSCDRAGGSVTASASFTTGGQPGTVTFSLTLNGADVAPAQSSAVPANGAGGGAAWSGLSATGYTCTVTLSAAGTDTRSTTTS